MKVFRDIENITINCPIATIGIFDGVHLAHQTIIEKLKQNANELSGESTIITLWPHPRIILQKDKNPVQLLNTLDEKISRLEKTGVDNLVIIPFDTIFAGTDFNEFVKEIMVQRIGIRHLVVGFNHQFGKDREGNFEKLQILSEDLGFGLSQQEPVLIEQEKVSSSAIRSHLEAGEIMKANQLLGYTYSISGEVVGGNQKGRKIGFPTANIKVNDLHKLVPKDGVYAILASTENKIYKGMMNIGCRPTLEEDCMKSILEAHLFEYHDDLYNKEIRIEFIQRIRDEKKFENLEELKTQIASDEQKIKVILASI